MSKNTKWEVVEDRTNRTGQERIGKMLALIAEAEYKLSEVRKHMYQEEGTVDNMNTVCKLLNGTADDIAKIGGHLIRFM